MSMSQNGRNGTNLYKSEEFEEFLRIIDQGQVDTWELVAETLGVNKNTIQNWKRHPLARQALAKGLQDAIKKMEEVGRRDWRMWREKAAMLRRELERKQDDDKSTITNNILVMGDDSLAKYLYGFVNKLAGQPALPEDITASESNAAGGEGDAVGEDGK